MVNIGIPGRPGFIALIPVVVKKGSYKKKIFKIKKKGSKVIRKIWYLFFESVIYMTGFNFSKTDFIFKNILLNIYWMGLDSVINCYQYDNTISLKQFISALSLPTLNIHVRMYSSNVNIYEIMTYLIMHFKITFHGCFCDRSHWNIFKNNILSIWRTDWQLLLAPYLKA